MAQSGEFHVTLSGVKGGGDSVIDALNEASLFAYRQPPSYRGMPGDDDLDWVAIIVESRDVTDSFEFQREILDTVGKIAEKHDFRIRSQGIQGNGDRNYLPYRILSPVVHPNALIMQDRPTVDAYWDQLRKLARDDRIPNYDDSGYHDVPSEVAREFAAYVRQAEEYYRAAQVTRGTSAALLLYYSILNLAKAEILLWKPEAIQPGNPIHHGLTAITRSDQLDEWKVKVRPTGVFPLLYEKRMGSPMPELSYEINARDLLSRCVESGVEFGQAGLGVIDVAPFYHAIVTDGIRSWSQLLVENYESVRANTVTHEAILDIFEELPMTYSRDLLQTFSISPRRSVHQSQLLSARRPKTVVTEKPGFVVTDLRLPLWVMEIRERLKPILGYPALGFDGFLSASLVSDRMIGLTPDLARYAAIFLVSNLVRYRPSTLDQQYFPVQAWYLESFVRQALLPALEAATSRLVGRELLMVDVNRP